MDGQANVSSIDALETFRADLIRFIEKAQMALEEAEGEVRRTRTWLEDNRSKHWMNEMKLRMKQFEQAEAEYYNARITRPKESHPFHKMAVAKAQRRIAEAEEKLQTIKRWRLQFDSRVSPLLRRLDPAFYMVGHHLPKGVVDLGEMIRALQAYSEKSAATKTAAAAQGGEEATR